MSLTTRRILVAMAIMLLCSFALGGVRDVQEPARPERPMQDARPFKLAAAGQIDLNTGSVLFGGVASHLGLYTASGFLNPADFSILGTIEAANGDMLNFTAFFSIGPIGEIQATFHIAGGTGRFADAVGTASGPVALDADFSFLIRAVGDLDY